MGVMKRVAFVLLASFLEALFRIQLAIFPGWWRKPTRSIERLKRLHSMRGWIYYHGRSKRQLASLHNKHKGERCFVICNGPSLNQTDLTKLEDEVTFGTNLIFLKFPELTFRPSYYVAMDDLVLEDRYREINALSQEGMVRFLPTEIAYCLRNNKDVIWMNCPDTDGDVGVPSFSKHPELFLFHGSTVTFICLQLAYHLGCDPVYLIGCDTSYSRPPSVEVIDDAHWISRGGDPNHFDSRYFGTGFRWHDPRTDLMIRSYKLARWIFEEDGRKIYNASAGGELEVFERIAYDSLFGK